MGVKLDIHTLDLYEEIDFNTINSNNGNLSVVENIDKVLSPVRRMFWIYEASPNMPRGRHRHKELNQIIFCLKGSIFLDLEYDGQKEKLKLSEDKTYGIKLNGKVWRNVIFEKKGSILLVLVDKNYEDDFVERQE